MKTETKKIELITATPDEGKRFVSRTDKVVADGKLYLPNAEAISQWEELDEAEALALKEQWEKEAEEESKSHEDNPVQDAEAEEGDGNESAD